MTTTIINDRLGFELVDLVDPFTVGKNVPIHISAMDDCICVRKTANGLSIYSSQARGVLSKIETLLHGRRSFEDCLKEAKNLLEKEKADWVIFNLRHFEYAAYHDGKTIWYNPAISNPITLIPVTEMKHLRSGFGGHFMLNGNNNFIAVKSYIKGLFLSAVPLGRYAMEDINGLVKKSVPEGLVAFSEGFGSYNYIAEPDTSSDYYLQQVAQKCGEMFLPDVGTKLKTPKKEDTKSIVVTEKGSIFSTSAGRLVINLPISAYMYAVDLTSPYLEETDKGVYEVVGWEGAMTEALKAARFDPNSILYVVANLEAMSLIVIHSMYEATPADEVLLASCFETAFSISTEAWHTNAITVIGRQTQ